MESRTPEPLLDKISSNITSLGSNHIPMSGSEIFVALGPEHAETIAAKRWTREDVQRYLFQRARLPVGQVKQAFAGRRWPHWMRNLGDHELLPMTDHPDNYRVFVTGGSGKHSQVMASFGDQPTSLTVPLSQP